MPLKRGESNKRYISSDSEESYCETPKKTIVAKRIHKLRDEEMVNQSSSFDIRLSNGKVNGISVDTTSLGINGSLNPVVSLNRDAIETHLKRKSIGFSATKGTPIGVSDEREERRLRQTERAVQQRRSAVGFNGTPSRGPTGSTITMNKNELTEHYTQCIQLSATNKINVKNAFALHLIDYMSELIKQSQKDQNNGSVNFKLAGSALDAGAKIYCNRVDSVHAEAQKVASSLVMALNNDKNQNNNNINENNNENEFNQMDDQNDRMDDEESGQRTKRKKTSRRNIKTLAQNIETLNVSKVETNLEIDPVFHHLSAAFDMGNVNSLLMANLKVSPNGMLLLDSNSSLNFDNNCINEPKMQNISKFYNVLNDVSKCSAKICPQLSTFEFLNRDNGIDLITREEDPSYARRDSFAFDLNAEVEDIDDMECDPDVGTGDIFENHNDDDSDTDGPLEVQESELSVKKSLIRAVNMQGVGDLVKMLSDKPNDYTYFNPKLLSSWAGPMHWKRMPFWNKKDRVEGQGIGDCGDKPRRQRRLFPDIKFDDDNGYNVKECDILGGSDQKLKLLTLQKWQTNESELKLPLDFGFDPKSLARSFIRPNSTFHCVKSDEEVIDTTINSNTSFGAPTSPAMDRYDYDDDDDIPLGGFTDPLELGQSVPLSQLNTNTNDMLAFIGDNLVEQPYDLQQYNITFAKFAKKMDVKKLKRAMWDVISPVTQPNTPITHETNIRQNPTNFNFVNLYKTLPQKITPMMAQNLSAPIAFVTLLHLCNERNLKLIGSEDLSDFTIESEAQE